MASASVGLRQEDRSCVVAETRAVDQRCRRIDQADQMDRKGKDRARRTGNSELHRGQGGCFGKEETEMYTFRSQRRAEMSLRP
jgi:hypothetical protein